MPIQHVNRKGDTYYLHQGKTKTGKVKWFFSTKAEGDLAESVPEGYEIYENPNAQVFLRKIVPQLVWPEEIDVVERGIRELAKVKHFIVEPKKNTIVVFLPHQDADSVMEGLRPFLGFGRSFPASLNVEQHLHYSPMLRFILTDDKKRLFSVDRWCFRGSIDDWFPLAGAADLSKQVKKYISHLGKDSFFNLM
jgi:hypothetical protein